MKHYLYLARDINNNMFKVGYTTNVKNRTRVYKTHNPNIKLEWYFEVTNKLVEKIVHLELKKRGYRENIRQKEWFAGNIHLQELKEIVDKFI